MNGFFKFVKTQVYETNSTSSKRIPTHFFDIVHSTKNGGGNLCEDLVRARRAQKTTYFIVHTLAKKKAFFHFGTQFFTFGFFCTSSIFLFGLRRRRHSVCTLNATIGSSILSEIFGNHKLSYYIVVHTTESIVLCAAAAATAVWRIFRWRCERRQ